MTIKNLLMAFCLLIIWQFVAVENVMGCPTCQGSLHGNTALGYAVSILLMMGMPFTIFSFWVVTIRRLRRTITR